MKNTKIEDMIFIPFIYWAVFIASLFASELTTWFWLMISIIITIVYSICYFREKKEGNQK